MQMPRGEKEPGILEGLRDAKCDWHLKATGEWQVMRLVAGGTSGGQNTEGHVGHSLECKLCFERRAKQLKLS